MSSKKPIHLTWNWIINESPENIWHLVTDTRQINSASGVFEKFLYDYKTDQDGIVLKETKTNPDGKNKPFTETPFEWVRPEYYQVTRYFKASPMSMLYYRVTLEPMSENRTHLSYTLMIEPRNQLSRFILLPYLKFVTYRGLDRAFCNINESLKQTTPQLHFSSPRENPPDINMDTFHRFHEAISADEFPAEYKSALVDAIQNWTNDQLVVIRPYEFADYYQLNRRKALNYLITCTEHGILKLEWRPFCPSCHGSGDVEYETLQEVSPHAYCPACHISYEALFDKGIEATFEVQQAIRNVSGEVYCTGGPEKTQHIWLQKVLQPGESFEAKLTLPRGIYSLHRTKFELLAHLDITQKNGSYDEVALDLGTTADDTTSRLNAGSKVAFRFTNTSDKRQIVQLHQSTDLSNIATAAEVTTLPRFRNFFNKALIRKGERFGVNNVVIMFTDLRKSTSLYAKYGDADAIGLIQQHFDILRSGVHQHYGSVIKTIGDAVMAVFYTPEDAIKASRQIVAEMNSFNEKNESELIIKLGLHMGSAFALTYDQKIDYFGTTINLCSRLEKLTDHADVVVTDTFQNQQAVQDYLAEQHAAIQEFEEPVRGIHSEPVKLHRITF